MSLVNDPGRATPPERFDEVGPDGLDGPDGDPRFTLASGRDVHARGTYAGVVFNRPIEQILTYRVPPRWAGVIQVGQRVSAPLGRSNKPEIGHCVGVGDEPPAGCEPFRVKEILEVVDPVPLIDSKMLALTRWLAEYYACSWGQALDSAVPAGVKKHAGTRIGTFLIVPEETRQGIREGSVLTKLGAKQAIALEVLARADEPLTVSDLCRLAKCTPGPIHALRKQGLIHSVRKRLAFSGPGAVRKALESAGAEANPDGRAPLTATEEQRAALDRLIPAVRDGGFAPFLIHGVTGSGKTEVYLRAIEEAVSLGREAIVLVPEISLTPQTIRRFRRRFSRVAVLHSHLSDAERHRHWQSIAAGEIEVVVGARSAIFAPTRRLGLIVIDEEHESTFKQETTPRYHARDVAVKRAQLEGIPVLLGSATPSLETWHNAERGRYTRLSLPSRVEGRPMPGVELIDLRHEKTPLAGLSESLRQAMIRALDDGGQVILLLNRRGFNTFAICPKCGEVLKCHSCDVAVTYHKSKHILICHTCDAERKCPPACPSCQASNLHYGGIGTERLEREILTAFPNHASRRMDSDTMRTAGSHEDVLNLFRSGEVRILLGTQMIAKGLDFPNVTLVGVVNADTSLHLPDFRAAERTFQLVAQVAGRTGRGDRPGRVMVQTYSPEHPAIAHAAQHDYEGFVATELPERRKYGAPPYGRLARIIARGPEESSVFAYMKLLAEALSRGKEPAVRVLGPAPAPIAKIRNLFRFHLQLRAPTARPIQNLVRAVPPQFPPSRGIELAIDIDPVNLL
jgi:primosomal protein N' (replication factor Y)